MLQKTHISHQIPNSNGLEENISVEIIKQKNTFIMDKNIDLFLQI